jgi:hypothetical protein
MYLVAAENNGKGFAVGQLDLRIDLFFPLEGNNGESEVDGDKRSLRKHSTLITLSNVSGREMSYTSRAPRASL